MRGCKMSVKAISVLQYWPWGFRAQRHSKIQTIVTHTEGHIRRTNSTSHWNNKARYRLQLRSPRRCSIRTAQSFVTRTRASSVTEWLFTNERRIRNTTDCDSLLYTITMHQQCYQIAAYMGWFIRRQGEWRCAAPGELSGKKQWW